MNMDKRLEHVPSEYKNADKTFIEKLKRDIKGSTSITSFHAFPYKVYFDGQEPTEHIILLLRQHWVVLLKPALFVALLILLSFLSFPYASAITENPAMAVKYSMSASIILWVVAFSIAVNSFAKWFFTINVVTDQRVVDLDFANLMSHHYAEAQLEKIEDVSHTHKGALASLFDFGTVTVQTAGALVDIEFDNIPRPRDTQDVMLDLLELKQEQKI